MVTEIEQKYINLHPGSAKRHEIARSIFPNGVTHDARRQNPFQLYYTHGEGPVKYDVDENRIIDYWSGHGALILGHSHPQIVQAVKSQIDLGTHLSGSTDLELEWAEWVRRLIPSADKVRFHSSGTEADMMAIRMARAYTGKSKVIKFQNHFHGWCDYLVAGSEGVGGIPQETLETVIILSPNDIEAVEQALQLNDDIAAIILEPTGAHMGLEPITPAFLQDLRDITNQHKVILIFDEVVTGFRTSRGGAQEYYGITPDMTTLAKILGGGLPGGAVTGKSELINMIETRNDAAFNQQQRIAHNGTFNANPLSAAAGIKALELVANSDINEIANLRATQLRDGLNELLSHMEISGCCSGVASLMHLRLGVEHECDKEICILTPDQMVKTTDSKRDQQLILALLNNGVHAGTRFIFGATHTEKDISDTVQAYEEALTDMRKVGLI